MKNSKISLNELENLIKENKPFIVNFGKGFNGKDVKELAYYDESIGEYRGDTGIWSYNLLFEIASGEVENTSLEEYDDKVSE